MEKNYLIHTKNGNKIITMQDIKKEVERQKSAGIKPCYFLRYDDNKNSRGGFLVWSTYEDGAGVAFEYDNGNIIVITGWQGEFECCWFFNRLHELAGTGSRPADGFLTT